MPRPLAVIFGATGGIGADLARRLAQGGWRLALVARTPERLQQLSEELSPSSAFSADVTSASEVHAVLERIQAAMGPPTAIAHCVGSILLKPAHLLRDEEWSEVLQLNLTSAFFVLRSGIKAFTAAPQPGASLVFCSTAAARIGLANHEAIAAAKAGLEGLVRSAAATYAARGIRVNAVAPGLVETPLSARITGSEAARKASLSLHPMRRLGKPQDIARALEFLIDPEQSWLTGQVLAVDGGLGALKTL